MTRVHTGVALAAALLLGACAVPRPPAAVDAAPPPRWHAPLPHNGTLTDLRQWWQQFNDPLLVELVEAAQTASPDVASAGSRIAQARAARVAAGAALLPNVDGAVAAQRGNLQAPPAVVSSWQASLQAGWEIDLFGASQAAVDASQARLEGAAAGWHQARVAVAAEVANAYVGLRTCERQLGVARNDARSRAETARLTDLTTQAGFTAPATSALARASAAESAARATAQQAQCALELKALVALSALPEDTLRRKLDAPWSEPARFALVRVPEVPAQLLAQRPDVYAAAREVAATAAEVGAARAERYPQLTLAGTIGVGQARVAGVTADLKTWSIGPATLTLPVFDAGRRRASQQAAEARYEEAAALYRAAARRAVMEVEQALVNLESARERSEDARVAVEGYRSSFAATEARYRSGLASLVELEDQRRAALAAETALVGLQRERLAAWIALYRAMGGGWEQQR